jgi:hypothetical protein
LATARACAPKAAGAIDIHQVPHRTTILQVEGEGEEIAIDHASGAIRLSLREGSLLHGPVQLTYLLEEPHLGNRLAALQRWHTLMQTGRIPKANDSVQVRAARWPLLLATLDAQACGCSLRQTAARVFGDEQVARHWRDPSDYLKMRVRRLVAQARALISGGYRDLL